MSPHFKPILRPLSLAAGLCLVSCLACTPIPEPKKSSQKSNGDGGPDRSSDAAPGDADDRDADAISTRAKRCDADGELRCAAGTRQRERCQDGHWVAAETCGEGEVCATTQTTKGQCSAVIDVCRGNADATVCDSAGTMFHCGGDGVVTSTEPCASPRHCQIGLAARSCASCLPGEFHCSGDALQVCAKDGRKYAEVESCGAGACDADAGLCRGATCLEQRAICEGDVLKVCARGAKEFAEVARCGPNLCNASAARCDVCVPGTHSCESDSAVTCTDDGSQRERRTCGDGTGHCVGAGQCVECARDADCASAGPCKSAYCDLVRGVCATEARPKGSSCPDGMCSADGTCVGCLSDSDCPAPGACELRSCDAATHSCVRKPAARGTRCGAGVCDASGTCVGCVDDSGCPAPGQCQLPHCEQASKSCEPAPAPQGQACTGSFGDGSCDNGRCVQCRGDSDCAGAGPCEQAFCRASDSSCQRRPAPAGAACGGKRVCDGASACVECTADLHCGANANCLSNTCRCKAGFVANPSGGGCNFDDCARPDDNHCASAIAGNTCKNTVDGYDCTCAAPWKLGADQCFQGGTSADVRTVKNGSSWNVFPDFGVVCDNAFDANMPCTAGQLTLLNVCGLPDTKPNDCSGIFANTSDTLLATNIKRVAHTGPLSDYGEPNGQGGEKVLLPSVGDVILVQTVLAVYLMRITGIDGGGMTYEWAVLWRDACWRPGGLTCTAACGCPDGN